MLLPIDQSDDSLLNFVRHIGSQSTYVSIEMYDLRQNIYSYLTIARKILISLLIRK